MLTKQLIDRFYRDVESLNLKFPVKVLSEKMGFTKSNVSEYLSRKKEPSENFINKFYECFENVPREGIDHTLSEDQNEYGINYRDKYIALLERENEKKSKIIDISLNELLLGSRISQAHLKTLLQITVVETAAIQKKNPDAALQKANKVVAENFSASGQKGM